MPYDESTIIEIRDKAADQLLEMLAHPKPTYSVDGQSFSWNEYREHLVRVMREMNTELAKLGVGFSDTRQVLMG